MGRSRIVYGGPVYGYEIQDRRSYGFFHFLWDLFMIFITCGLWLIWIFIREMRNR